MTFFRTQTSTALALILSLSMPALAQEQASGDGQVIEPMAQADMAPMADPSVVPEGWVGHSYFGAQFSLPEGFVVEEYNNNPQSGLVISMKNVDPETDHGAAYGVMFLPQNEAAATVASMRQEMGEEVLREGEAPVMIGGRSFSVYSADNVEQGGMSLSMRIHMGTEPTASGLTPMVMMIYNSVDPADWQAVEDGFRASIAYSEDAASLGQADPVSLRDGALSMRIPEGWRQSGGISPDFDWITLRGQDGRIARIVVSDVGAAAHDARFHVSGNMTGPLDLSEGTFAGQPVWIVSGRAAYDLSATRTVENDGWQTMMMITQNCPPGRGPIAIELVTSETARNQGVTPNSALSSLIFAMDDAVACDPAIGAGVQTAVDESHPAATPPQEPEQPSPEAQPLAVAEVPTDWVAHERFGIRLRAPNDMTVRRERTGEDRMEYWLTNEDRETQAGAHIALRILSSSARTQITDATPGTPEFDAFLSNVSPVPVSRTPDFSEIGGMTFQHYRGSGYADATETDPNAGLETHVTYLINEADPGEEIYSPWIALSNVGASADEAALFVSQVIAGLEFDDLSAIGQPAHASVLNGLARVSTPEGMEILGVEENARTASVYIGRSHDEGAALHIRVGYLPTNTPTAADILSRNLHEISSITPGALGNAPAWVINATTLESQNEDRLAPEDAMPTIVYAQRRCDGDAGAPFVNFTATAEVLAASGGYAGLWPLVQMRDALETPCLEGLDIALQAQDTPAEPPAVAEVAPAPPAAVMPDPADPKDPALAMAPAVGPQVEAWARAEASQSVAEMIAYLEAYPDGPNAADARQWLTSRAIMPPGAAPAPMPTVAPSPVPAPPREPMPALSPLMSADDMGLWAQTITQNTPEAFWTYLKAQPTGQFAELARTMLRLQSMTAPSPAPSVPPAANDGK